MSDIKLFRYSSTHATELAGKAASIEKTLQNVIEARMEAFLGVRFSPVSTAPGPSIAAGSTPLGWMKTAARSSSSTSAIATRTSSTRACFISTGYSTTKPTSASW